MLRNVAALAALLALGAPPALAARVDAPALPIDRVLTIQPIQVCGGGTIAAPTACAPTTFLPQYLTAANVLLNQAGIAVAAAPTRTIVDARYINPTTNNTAFDNLRDLLRLPGNGQSEDPNTLNVWFVNTLRNVTNPAAPTNFYGFGLIGGNGAVVATGLDAGRRTAAVDTLAHELAHNLGLPHPEDAPRAPTTETTPALGTLPWRDPRNLMQSVGRAVFTDLCQVPPYTCATGTQAANARGVLVQAQRTALRAPPIFRELPNTVVTARPDPVLPGVVSLAELSFRAPGFASLASLQLRYRDNSAGMINVTGSVPLAVTRAVSPDNNLVITVRPTAPTNFPSTFELNLANLTGDPARLLPYSSQYDFTNGITSRAGFDVTGQSFALGGAELAFDPARAIEPPPDPSFLLPSEEGAISPITRRPVEVIIDTNFSTPEQLASFALPFTGFETPPAPAPFDPPPPPFALPPVGVPGPGALGLFVLGLAGVLLIRRGPVRG